MQLYTKIFLGLILGAVVGALVNLTGLAGAPLWVDVIRPPLDFIGSAFIRAITMIVIPLVVASLMLGVTALGDVRKLGRIGGKTVGYYMVTTALAITIGLLLAVAVKPGSQISAESRDTLAQEFSAEAGRRLALAADRPDIWQILLDMIPNNPIAAAAEGNLLPLIIFVVIFGAAVTLVAPERREVFVRFFEAINDACMVLIEWIMKLAPYAVFALIASVISRFGIDILGSLAVYAGVVVVGLTLHVITVYGSAVAVLARINPLEFFRRIRKVMMIAFSTSSSNATLPVTIETAEKELGVSTGVASFVLPLGATVNMDGTALYQGVATVFIAQVYGVDLGFAELLTIVLTATLASIGAAGVPSAGIITLVLVLQSVGLAGHAAAGIALILGVDRILDMMRTVVNVTGDLSAAAFVARTEGEIRVPAPAEPEPDVRPLGGVTAAVAAEDEVESKEP